MTMEVAATAQEAQTPAASVNIGKAFVQVCARPRELSWTMRHQVAHVLEHLATLVFMVKTADLAVARPCHACTTPRDTTSPNSTCYLPPVTDGQVVQCAALRIVSCTEKRCEDGALRQSRTQSVLLCRHSGTWQTYASMCNQRMGWQCFSTQKTCCAARLRCAALHRQHRCISCPLRRRQYAHVDERRLILMEESSAGEA
jgi:hypothetical protein